MDLLLLWWLVLGIPLAWDKGSLCWDTQPHEWIGIKYILQSAGKVLMELPEKFLKDLLEQLEPFCTGNGKVNLREAEKLVGRAGRVAHVVPTARPFVSALWAALTASKADALSGKNRTGGRVIATRRFRTAAGWLRALIRGDDSALLPLQRIVSARSPTAASASTWAIQFDASTTGGGAVLRCHEKITEYFIVEWTHASAEKFGIEPRNSKHQTFWECLTLVLALCVWGNSFTHEAVAVLGDNTGALQDALNLKGKGVLAAVARELSWRQARGGWAFEVGHVPAERNTVPDALSRQFENKPSPLPHAVSEWRQRSCPDLANFWKASA